MRTTRLLTLILVLALAACEGSDGPAGGPDVPLDAADTAGPLPDAPGDTAGPLPDAPGDTASPRPDAPGDTAGPLPDARGDAGGPDVPGPGPDAAAADGGAADGGAADGDAGRPPPWAECPGPEAFVAGGDGGLTLAVTDGAVYCAAFQEENDPAAFEAALAEESARKSLLRIAPGEYDLPLDGPHAFRLPLCLRFRDDQLPPLVAGEGTVTVTHWADGYNVTFRQPLRTAEGVEWSLEGSFAGALPAGSGAIRHVLDGTHGHPFEGPFVSFLLCRGGCESFAELRWYDSCDFAEVPESRHEVTFEGGDATLVLRIGEAPASTEPGVFVRATGTLDGEGFAQEDYWRLLYVPAHHHFERSFGVLFDAPIGAACGLRVERLTPWPDELAEPAVRTMDCDLSALETRAVTGHTYVRGEPAAR